MPSVGPISTLILVTAVVLDLAKAVPAGFHRQSVRCELRWPFTFAHIDERIVTWVKAPLDWQAIGDFDRDQVAKCEQRPEVVAEGEIPARQIKKKEAAPRLHWTHPCLSYFGAVQ